VTVNRVGGTVSDPLACTGPGNTVRATLVIGNNGNVNQNVADTTTFTNLVGVPNSCTVSPNVGACSITNGSLTYTGTLTPGQVVTISYLTQVSDLAPAGAQVCTNNSVTFNGGPPFAFSVCDVVDCPSPGPGLPFPARRPRRSAARAAHAPGGGAAVPRRAAARSLPRARAGTGVVAPIAPPGVAERR
jgi:hypothetical protein